MRKFLFAALCLAFLSAGASWAGIGVYEVAITGDCPYPITYLLNKDATSVTIEVIRTSDNFVAKTWSYTSPDAHCDSGLHTDLSWDPANDVPVPGAGNYKLKVSAAGAAVSGYGDPNDPKLMPAVWERLNPDGSSEGWRPYGIAVNKNPTSPLYGRVYVSNWSNAGGKAKGVYEFLGDGTQVGKLPDPAEGWGGSAPWGIEFDDDDHLYIEDRTSGRYFQYTYNGTSWARTDMNVCQQGRGITVTGSGDSFRVAETYWAQGGSSVPPSNNSRIAFGTDETPHPPDIKNPPSPYYPQTQDDTFIGACFVGTDLYIAGAVGAGAGPEPGEVSVWDTTQSSPWSGNYPTTTRYPNYSRATGIDIYNGSVWLGRITGMVVAGEYDYTDSRDTDVPHQTIYKFPLGDIATIDPYNSPPASFKTYGVGTAYTGTYKYPFFVKADPVGNLALTAGHGTIIGYTANFFGVYEEPLGATTADDTSSRMTVYWPGEYVPVYVSGGAVPGDSSSNPIVADGATPTRVTVVAEDRNNTVAVNDIASVKVWSGGLGWGQFIPSTTNPDPSTGWPMTVRSRDGIQNTYWNDVTVAAGSGAGWHTVKVYLYDVHYPSVPLQEGQFDMYVSAGKISGTITEGNTGYAAANVTVQSSYTDAYGTYLTQPVVTDANGNYLIDATAATTNSVYPAQQPDEISSGKTYPGATYPTEFNVANAHGASGAWPDNLGASDWPINNVAVTLGATTTGVNGHLWPLVASQVTYKWAAAQYRAGGRTVCSQGIVTRQGVDAAHGDKGYNGYYFVGDTKTLGVNMGVKIKTRVGDPEIVSTDKVVVIGTYDKDAGYTAGAITPTKTPVVLSHNNTQLPVRTMDRLSYFNGNVLYTYYKVLDGEIMSVDAPNEQFTVKLPYDASVVLCDVDTLASTGIALPSVGDRVDMYCVLDQSAPGVRALRPGLGTDVHVIPIASELGVIKSATDGTAIFDSTATPLIVTYVDPLTYGDFPEDLGKWFWVEQLTKTGDPKPGASGLKVYSGASHEFLPDDGLVVGDTITHMKGQLFSKGTPENDYLDQPRELQLTEKPIKGTPTVEPSFVDLTVRSFGGGWLSDLSDPSAAGDGTPPVINAINPTVHATGLNTEGILVKVAGKVVGYGSDGTGYTWCWIDDGSGTVSDVSSSTDYPPSTRMTGIKCVRIIAFADPWPSIPSDIGRPVSITGLCSNRYLPDPGRIRMLHVRCIPGTAGGGLDQLDWLDD